MNQVQTQQELNRKQTEAILFYCMELTGFKPENITAHQLNTIIDYLENNFKFLRLEELKQAFEIGVAGKLDVDLKHYQSFNTLYIANILQSFKRYKADKKRHAPQIIEQPLLPYNEEIEQRRSYEIIKEEIFLADDERNGKRGTFPDLIIANWKEAYLYLISTGKLKELQGQALTKRIREANALIKSEETNDKKRLANAFNKNLFKDDVKTMRFYKLEVVDYIKQNVE